MYSSVGVAFPALGYLIIDIGVNGTEHVYCKKGAEMVSRGSPLVHGRRMCGLACEMWGTA
jgi:hypothetical protein